MQFGVPNYGGSLTGQLVYVPSNAQACSPFAESLAKDLTPGQVPVALLDRGGCTFVTKTAHAQAAGPSRQLSLLVVLYLLLINFSCQCLVDKLAVT
jgi:hypothetical protein